MIALSTLHLEIALWPGTLAFGLVVHLPLLWIERHIWRTFAPVEASVKPDSNSTRRAVLAYAAWNFAYGPWWTTYTRVCRWAALFLIIFCGIALMV